MAPANGLSTAVPHGTKPVLSCIASLYATKTPAGTDGLHRVGQGSSYGWRVGGLVPVFTGMGFTLFRVADLARLERRVRRT